MNKLFSKLSDITNAKELVSFIDRIDIVDKITICHNGDILSLLGCPRGIDITVGLKAYWCPELLDEDLEIGYVHIEDRYSEEKNKFRVDETALRDIYHSVLGLMRRWYLVGINEKDKLKQR